LLPGTKGIKTKVLLELGREGGWRQAGGLCIVHPPKHSVAALRG
jgi:hypothetical protein